MSTTKGAVGSLPPSDLINASTADFGASAAKGCLRCFEEHMSERERLLLKGGDKGFDQGFEALDYRLPRQPRPEPTPAPAPLVQQPLGELLAKLLGGFCIPCQAAAAA